ncbi:ATP-grasp domain-containing protein [Halalkalibacterium ligniniphilum]|uniref:ATP-grasp domain-containing protein n=1 Tax=Halalkalibacterium ligniniphilum TaxID=1134413 RepID=UPI000345450F|nr:RimK family alpha-L-glutamate ligase [Halalkalibacterium ligniniphilum]
MKLVTFNPFRTIGMSNLKYVKPEHMFEEREKIEQADVCLFPENWQVNALVYGMKKQIFPSIQSIQLGHNKIEVTRALWSVCPEHVPRTLILGRNHENIDRVFREFAFPFVAKEIRSSMGKGVFLIETREQFHEYVENNPYFYVQEYMPIDRDLRVCVVGDEVISAYWRINERNHFRNNVAQGARISFDSVPNEAIELVLKTAKQLGIDHAGFDVIEVGGKFYFLEFNILFGNQAFQFSNVSVEQKIEQYLQRHFTESSQ